MDRTTWEYKVISLKAGANLFKMGPDDEAIMAALNHEGAAGWELVGAIAIEPVRQIRLFFKRPR